MIIDTTQSLGERGGGQAYNFNVRIILDELDCLISGLMAFIHNQKLKTRKITTLF